MPHSRKEKNRSQNELLLKSIALAKYELDTAHKNFSYATDPLLVDMYAYQIKSSQAKYSYLMAEARKTGLIGAAYIRKPFEKTVNL